MNSAKIQTKNFAITKLLRKFAALKRKVGRVIECAGLEIRYTHCGYRGFESLTFRQKGNRQDDSLFILFARHGHNLTGASSERGLIAASAQPKTRCQRRRWV